MIYFPTIIFYFTFVFCGAFGLIFSANQDLYSYYLRPDILPKAIENQLPPPILSAKSVLLVDNATGSVLFEKNATTTRPIASLSKLMTALVFLEEGQDLSEEIEITKNDYREGNQIFLNEYDRVKKNDLLELALIASSNEAAAAMSNNSGIDDFVAAMNRKAKILSLDKTAFYDPTGLDPRNVSSAWDLLTLAQNAFLHQEISSATQKSNYYFLKNNKTNITAVSTNKFLTSESSKISIKVLAAKTGYLNEAGYCLILWLENENHKSLTLVLLGAETEDSRWQEAKGLIEWVQKNHLWQ